MVQKPGESYCVLKDCYKYDENLGVCAQDGYHYGGPLALQAIPMTGVFGSWLWEYRKMGCVWNVYGNNNRRMLFYTSNIMFMFICVS